MKFLIALTILCGPLTLAKDNVELKNCHITTGEFKTEKLDGQSINYTILNYQCDDKYFTTICEGNFTADLSACLKNESTVVEIIKKNRDQEVSKDKKREMLFQNLDKLSSIDR